jgi:hypothetical protein
LVRSSPPHCAPEQTFEGSLAHAARPPCGAPTTGRQRPERPVAASTMSHASHCPVHAVSQHTPSTQWPEPHSASAPHVEPLNSMHVPSCPNQPQVAPVGHLSTLQQTPSTQVRPDLQSTVAEHFWPVPSSATHAPVAASQ